MFVCVCARVCEGASLFMSMCVCVCVCVCLCASVYVFICLCVFACFWVRLSVFLVCV